MVTARIFYEPETVEILEFGSSDRVTNRIMKTIAYHALQMMTIDNWYGCVPVLITTDKGYIYAECVRYSTENGTLCALDIDGIRRREYMEVE